MSLLWLPPCHKEQHQSDRQDWNHLGPMTHCNWARTQGVFRALFDSAVSHCGHRWRNAVECQPISLPLLSGIKQVLSFPDTIQGLVERWGNPSRSRWENHERRNYLNIGSNEVEPVLNHKSHHVIDILWSYICYFSFLTLLGPGFKKKCQTFLGLEGPL